MKKCTYDNTVALMICPDSNIFSETKIIAYIANQSASKKKGGNVEEARQCCYLPFIFITFIFITYLQSPEQVNHLSPHMSQIIKFQLAKEQ